MRSFRATTWRRLFAWNNLSKPRLILQVACLCGRPARLRRSLKSPRRRALSGTSPHKTTYRNQVTLAAPVRGLARPCLHLAPSPRRGCASFRRERLLTALVAIRAASDAVLGTFSAPYYRGGTVLSGWEQCAAYFVLSYVRERHRHLSPTTLRPRLPCLGAVFIPAWRKPFAEIGP